MHSLPYDTDTSTPETIQRDRWDLIQDALHTIDHHLSVLRNDAIRLGVIIDQLGRIVEDQRQYPTKLPHGYQRRTTK